MSAPSLFEQPPGARLLVGERYQAIGPAEDSKLGPPPEVLITGTTPRGYVTKGARQCATLIAYGCERFWAPAGL